MVELEIKKQYEKFRLDVAFKSEKKRIGILGASGCGKSLTLKSIAGIERPEKGRIVIDGVTLFDAGKKIFLKPQKRKVGYLFQNYALFPNMTVEQNIGIGFTGNKEDMQKMVDPSFPAGRTGKALSVKAFRRTAAENRTGTDYGI